MAVRAVPIVVIAICLLGSAAVRAATPDPAETRAAIQGLIDEAATALDGYSYRKAQSSLQRALRLASAARLGRDPKLAQVLVMVGVAEVSGANDLYRGLHAFVQALRLDPKVQVPAKFLTPQLTEMFNKARQTVKEIGKPPTIRLARVRAGQADKPQKSGVRGLAHTPIDTAKRGYPLVVKAEAGTDIQAQRVILFFRHAGTVQFIPQTMQRTGNVFRAVIPADALGGRYVHYYLEARDQRGRLAASSGSARSPVVVIIE